MLKGIDPLLRPGLLAILRAMGHGDELVDANFPARALARRLIRLDGHSGERVLEAVMSLLPLGGFPPSPVLIMTSGADHVREPGVIGAYRLVLRQHGFTHAVNGQTREELYSRTRDAFAVAATGKRRLYANVILRKGVLSAGAVP